MDFEWDPRKAKLNLHKHKVSFFEACEVFADQFSSMIADPDHSKHEQRFLLFGRSLSGKFIVVSYTERYDQLRIISARKMTPGERKAYE